ncbi:hypothetical protein X971_4205 [Agrobacterium tumefaciens LBA4213 (Ach5)]|nr:hypothetical protein X971_4205 [Agrobacterium tumefaciens LBA4213 (Ach5)]
MNVISVSVVLSIMSNTAFRCVKTCTVTAGYRNYAPIRM